VALTVARKSFVHTANTNSIQILQKVSMYMCMYVPRESKKQDTLFVPITLKSVDRFFKNSFTLDN